MGRNKFEDQFRERLSQREITPSQGSWEKLSGQLNSEEKKPAPIFWWLGIAASLLGAILIAGIVYNNNSVTGTPGLVESPVEIEKEDIDEAVAEQELQAQENIITVSATKEEPVTPPKERIPGSSKPSENTKLLADVNPENVSGPIKIQDEGQYVITPDDEKISQKLEEVIAQVSLKDGGKGDTTYDEIDALLYKAASEISLERRNIKSHGTVDAGDLLYSVEMELEESFRERVFDLLKEGFLKARTAVANRSYP